MDHEPARKLSTNLYDIRVYHYWVYSEQTPDVGQRNCPKYVVSCQNKFVKLVHLVGFIIEKKGYSSSKMAHSKHMIL